jgi:hypothetical protein
VAAAGVLAVPLMSPGGPLSFSDIALAEPSLAITGDIDGLQLDQPAELTLTLRNKGNAGIVVHRLDARVTSAAHCSPGALHVTGWTGQLQVAARSAQQVVLPVTLTRPCADATWMLSYTSS